MARTGESAVSGNKLRDDLHRPDEFRFSRGCAAHRCPLSVSSPHGRGPGYISHLHSNIPPLLLNAGLRGRTDKPRNLEEGNGRRWTDGAGERLR